MNINEKYIKDRLSDLLSIPSPSGYCSKIMEVIENEANNFGYSFSKTNKGCGIIRIDGKNKDYVIGLSAHVDTLGAMVRSVTSTGTIKFTSIGGYLLNSIEGEYCKVHTRDGAVYEGTILTSKPSVHVYKDAGELKRDFENMEIRLDEDVENDEDVKSLGIEVGDYISFNPRSKFFDNGYIKSRHLDDKAGVACLLGFMEYLKTNQITPDCSIMIFISVYEEIGHGASYIPSDVNEMIAVDMGAIGDDLQCTEKQVSICAKDSSGPYDYDIVTKLINLAKNNDINYAVDIYPYYGSDVSSALRGSNNIKGGLIGPGVHASHSLERTHTDALMNTTKLLVLYVTQ